MKTAASIFALFLLSFAGFSQDNKYPLRKLSIEPAIGLRLSAAFGLIDVQFSGLVQYQLNKRFSLASHTAISFDVNSFKAFKNINPKYSITTFQKFGIGTSVYTKHSSHTLFLMAGGKYFAYSASIDNPKLEDNVKSRFSTIAFDKGLLYNLKIGRGNPYFSGRIYAPVFDGKWIMLENTSLEFGAGFRLK
jgi:hypothetical protein